MFGSLLRAVVPFTVGVWQNVAYITGEEEWDYMAVFMVTLFPALLWNFGE